MIVVTSALRTARRPRRTASVASLLRALASVRISEQPPPVFSERSESSRER